VFLRAHEGHKNQRPNQISGEKSFVRPFLQRDVLLQDIRRHVVHVDGFDCRGQSEGAVKRLRDHISRIEHAPRRLGIQESLDPRVT
jgi:hypothetical protein